MKRLFTSLLLFTLLIFKVQGQSNKDQVKITGKVIEGSTGKSLEYSTIVILNLEGKVITGGIADANGNYSVLVSPGIYNINFEFIGFKTKSLKNQSILKNTVLPDVALEIDSESLDEVIVTAKTTEVEIRLDKKIYNIGKDLTTAGSTVGDALAQVPSVTVDADGAIALRGNGNVRILINGRPSAIAGFGSTDALQSLPADAIERVEVITSPSARYDAEGTAGILNIILKRERTLGFNGSVQTFFRYPLGAGATGNVNLRTDKLNVFTTTSFNRRTSPGQALFNNQFFSDNVTNPTVIESRDFDRSDIGFNTNFGIEYFFNSRSSITASFFLSDDMDDDETLNTTREFDPNDNLAFNRIRTEFETEEDNNVQFSMNYINRFNDSGHNLTVDFQYGKDEEAEASLIDEVNTFPSEEILPSEFITTKEDGDEVLVQADYVYPIGENAQFEAGFRSNLEETTTAFVATEQDVAGGNFITNTDLTNTFIYNEDVNAVYTQYGNKFGKFSFLAGLRYEHTRLAGFVEGQGNNDVVIDFDNSYSGLFPTLNLNYELSDSENFTFGYNRRINRPRGRFVNPFPSRSSEANIFQGNPSLNPAFANAFDLGYLKKWGKKLTLTTSVYYQNETDAFERIQEDTGQETPNGIPIIRTIPINLSTNERIGFEAGVLYNPLDWLQFNGSFNFFQFNTEGSFNGIDYGTKNTSYFSRLSAKVDFADDFQLQTNAIYRGPNNNAQTETESILFLNLALSKDVLKGNGTIALNVRDVFNSRKRISLTEAETFRSDSEFQFRVRTITASFIYRFNQKKEREKGSRDNNDAGGDDDF